MDVNVNGLRTQFEGKHHLIKSLDGTTLFLREWSNGAKTDVGVLILHGVTAYSGPYHIIGNPLSENGFTCYGLDLRGHGLSDGIRGDYPNRKVFLQDLQASLDFMRQTHKKIIVFGHSLGVLVASYILNNNLADLDGLVLFSAAKSLKEGVIKRLSLGKLLKILFFSIFLPSKPVLSYYREGMQGLDDPLFTFKYTLRFFKVVNPRKIVTPEKLDMPVYFGIGENDELFSVPSAKELFGELNSSDKEFYVIPNANHAVFPLGSWDPLIKWLKQHF